MKKITLLIIVTIVCQYSFGQIEPGINSWFDDGTTEGWTDAPGSPNPPEVISVPVYGNVLQEVSDGTTGPGAGWLVYNENSEWTGNYFTAVFYINDIGIGIRNLSSSPMHIRLGFEGNGTQIVSTEAILVPAEMTAFQPVNFFDTLELTGYTVVNGTGTVEDVLANVEQVRFINNENISFESEATAITAQVDYIYATESIIGVEDHILLDSLTFYPNPTQGNVTFEAQIELETYQVFDLQGREVMSGTFQGNSIDLSSFTSGMYFVAVHTENSSRTVKIIKQ